MPQGSAVLSRVYPQEKSSRNRFFQIFPWIWLIVAYLGTILIMCICCRGYIDSDMSSEMILADLLNQEGGLLSTNWWYSTELRCFCLQLFLRPGLFLFPHNWYAARMFAQALLLLAVLLAYLYVGDGLGLQNRGAWGAAALMCPFGTWYFWYCPFGGYYLPHALWIMLTFGAILHLIRRTSPAGRLFQIVLLLFSCGASGLNGLKGLMGFYVPMLIAAVAAVLLQLHREPKRPSRSLTRILVLSVFSLLIAGIGYVINSTVLTKTHQFSNYNNRTWNTLNLNTLLSKWADFLSLFGYPTDSLMQNKVPLLSLIGILGVFGLLIAGALVFSVIRLLRRWRDLSDLQLLSVLLFTSILIVQGLVFSCTGDPNGVNASYWLTVVPFAFPILQIEVETEHFHFPQTRKFAALAFCCCITFSSIGTLLHFWESPLCATPKLEQVCDILVEQNYTQGYATFWNGNVMTEWSSGQLEMWVVHDFNSLSIYQWLQSTSHSVPPEGEVFLLSTHSELSSMGLDELPQYSNIIYDEEDGYIVLAYPSTDEMLSIIHSVNPPAE